MKEELTLQELTQSIAALEELRYAKSRAWTLQHLHDLKDTLDIKGTTINGHMLEIPLPEYGQCEVMVLSVDSHPVRVGEAPDYSFEGPGVTTGYVSDILEGLEGLAGRATHKVREAQDALKEAEDLLKAYTNLLEHARTKFPKPDEE